MTAIQHLWAVTGAVFGCFTIFLLQRVMTTKDWLPSRDAELAAWYENYLKNVDGVVAALNLPPAQFANATQQAQAWLTKYADAQAARRTAEGLMDDLHQQAPLSATAVRAARQQLLHTPGFTPQQSALLQLQGAETNPQELAAAQAPELQLSREGGQVVVKFKKLGHQGILLYGRRGTEADFTLLGADTHSPYHDTRPNLVAGQPETRQYQAYFMDRDQPVGELGGRRQYHGARLKHVRIRLVCSCVNASCPYGTGRLCVTPTAARTSYLRGGRWPFTYFPFPLPFP